MPTFEEKVSQYVQLRDAIKTKDDEHKALMKPYRELLDNMNAELLQMLNETGQESAKTAAGTAYRKEDVSATIADAETFRRHVIGTEAWDLIDWRANKTAVKALVAEAGEPPPGVNFTRRFDVGVRRANGGE